MLNTEQPEQIKEERRIKIIFNLLPVPLCVSRWINKRIEFIESYRGGVGFGAPTIKEEQFPRATCKHCGITSRVHESGICRECGFSHYV